MATTLEGAIRTAPEPRATTTAASSPTPRPPISHPGRDHRSPVPIRWSAPPATAAWRGARSLRELGVEVAHQLRGELSGARPEAEQIQVLVHQHPSRLPG